MFRLTNRSYISVITTIYVLLYALGAGYCYGKDKSHKNHLQQEDTSPNGNIIVRYYDDGDDICPRGDIWLYSKDHPSKKALLFSYERDADILISPDEKWIVINHRVGNNITELILFKKVKGLKYERIAWIDVLAWNLFRKTHSQYKIPEFFHNYTEAVRWSSDSKSVLIYIYGHDDETPKKLEPWYCVYDVTTDAMTLDFNRVFNRDAYHPNGKAKSRKIYKH